MSANLAFMFLADTMANHAPPESNFSRLANWDWPASFRCTHRNRRKRYRAPRDIFVFFFFLLFIESDIYTKPFAIVCLLSRVMEVKCYDRLPISLAQNGNIIWRQMNEWTQSSHLGLDWFFVFVFHSNRTRIDCFRIRDTPACEWILCDSADSYVSPVNLSADRVLDSSSAQNIYFSLPAHTIFNWDAVAILLLFFFPST